MKSFKLVFILTLLVAFVGMTAIAGVPVQKKATSNIKPAYMPTNVFTGSGRGPDDNIWPNKARPAMQDPPEKQTGQKLVKEKPFMKPLEQIPARAMAPLPGGEYRIGPGQDFNTLHDALLVLTYAYISGPVKMLLTQSSYTENGEYLGAVPGASATNTITFQPDSNVTSVTITLADNSSLGGGWTFEGSSYVTINGTKKNGTPGEQDLTIQFAAGVPASGDAVIRVRDGCSFVTVENCILPGYVANPVVNITTSGTPNTDITVSNCRISNGVYGVASTGNAAGVFADVANWDQRINVLGCDIGNPLRQIGIFLRNVQAAHVAGNHVHDVSYGLGSNSSSRVAGMYLLNTENSLIEKNTVDSIFNTNGVSDGNFRAYGIRLEAFPIATDPSFDGQATYNTIRNNFITQIMGSGNGATVGIARDYGIEDGQIRMDYVQYNTVVLSGDGAALGHPGGATCLYTYGNRGTYYTAYGFTAMAARCMSNNNVYVLDRTYDANNAIVKLLADNTVDYRASSDRNVMYAPNGNVISGGYPDIIAWKNYNPGADLNSVGWNPYLLAVTGPQWDPTLASSASNLGLPIAGVTTDLFGTSRDATHPDAGAWETATTAPTFHDAKMAALLSPGGAGLPQGIPFSPFTLEVQNETPQAEASVSVNIKIYDPTMTKVYDHSSSGTDALPGAFGSTTIDIPATWIPAVGGSHTYVAVVSLAGDGNILDDTLTGTFNIAGLKTTPYSTGFETDGDRDGWYAAGDFMFANTGQAGGFTKLGGPHNGNWAAVTEVLNGDAGHYQDQTCGLTTFLYTPYFDLTANAHPVISFYHSIATEPVWDGSTFQYSLDTGKTWHDLGVANDPNGVNWYSTTVYANATSNDSTCWGPASSSVLPANCSPGTANATDFQIRPKWTSNGDCEGLDLATGPFGYVYVQYNDAGGIVGGKNYVRFRYRTYSDYGGGAGSVVADGWAVDDFAIGASSPAFAGKISGTVWTDVNGNGTKDGGDAAEVGTTVRLTYFGIALPSDTIVTDGSGFYLFTNLKPGTYNVSILKPGWAMTSPAYTGATLVHNGTDSVGGTDIGDFQGTISGTVFEDLNGNGAKNIGEPGMSGYVVSMHTDSVTGAVLATAVTDSVGGFSIVAGPATYYLTEAAKATARQTLPASNGADTVGVTGNSGDPSANPTGKNFGNFRYGTLDLSSIIDKNGDGFQDSTEFNPAPAPPGIAIFTIYKGATLVAGPDTIGGGLGLDHIKTVTGLDFGSYTAMLTYISPGWLPTAGTSFTKSVAISGQALVDTFLAMSVKTVSGTVFFDANGNGTKNAADTVAQTGVTIVLRGLHGTRTTTTDNTGAYSAFLGFATDSLYVSEILPAGCVRTSPTAVFAFAINNTVAGQNKTANFLNFKGFSVSGTVYTDRNLNGVRDPGEAPLVRVLQLSASGMHTTDTSAADGSYSFANIGVGPDTLQEISIPLGWAISQPPDSVQNRYTFTGVSGVNLTRDFGNVILSDTSIKFRTFTPAEYYAAYGTKAVVWSKTQSKVVKPNLITALSEMGKTLPADIIVGEAGVAIDLKTTRPYVQPGTVLDLTKTFYGKSGMKDSLTAGTPARGLDFYNGNIKPILNRQKSLPPDKQNNVLVAELMALKVNIKLSSLGNTQPGFGELIYNEAGNSLSGLMIKQIATKLDTLMTNWTTVYSVYTNFDTVIQKINAAFSGNGAFDTVSWNTVKPGFVVIKGVKSVHQISFLKPNPTLVPRIVPQQAYVYTPPANYALLQNYPNPFNPTTSIPFDLPQQAVVTLKIYNMLGQEIATLLDHQMMDADRQEVTFDASALPSGVYFYRIMATGISDGSSAVKNFTQVKKMLLLK